MNSVSLFQSCADFQKHCRGNSILTPEDPQKKKKEKKKSGEMLKRRQKLFMLSTSVYFV